MAYSQQKHFWTWFQRHSEMLLKAHKGDKKEEEYWVREIQTHLRAFTKKLHPVIVWNDNGVSSFIITAENKTKYFNMAEKLAAKAPVMPGWQVIGLCPPGLLPQEFLEGIAAKEGVDMQKCWFVPPHQATTDGKWMIDIYVEIYQEINDSMCHAVEDCIINLLGEKTIGWEIGYIDIESLFNRTEEQKKQELIPIHQLPEYITSRNITDFRVDETGKLVTR